MNISNLSTRSIGECDSHLDRLVSPTANYLVRHKVYAVNLVGVSWEINSDFSGLQIPELNNKDHQFRLCEVHVVCQSCLP